MILSIEAPFQFEHDDASTLKRSETEIPEDGFEIYGRISLLEDSNLESSMVSINRLSIA